MKNLVVRVVHWRVARYLISGGSATVTTVVLLFVLVHFFNVWYLPATVVSYIAGVCVSFFMQKFFTFNDYSRDTLHQQTGLYLAIQLFNLSANTLLMYVSVDLLHMHYVLSQLVIAGAVALYSFFAYKHIVFYSKLFTTKDVQVPPHLRP